MENIKLEAFTVVRIAVKTTNKNGQSATDIGALWQKIMGEGIIEKIPNKIDYAVYSVYTEYEGDYTKPYTTVLGCKVSDTSNVQNATLQFSMKKKRTTKKRLPEYFKPKR